MAIYLSILTFPCDDCKDDFGPENLRTHSDAGQGLGSGQSNSLAGMCGECLDDTAGECKHTGGTGLCVKFDVGNACPSSFAPCFGDQPEETVLYREETGLYIGCHSDAFMYTYVMMILQWVLTGLYIFAIICHVRQQKKQREAAEDFIRISTRRGDSSQETYI